MSDVDEPVPDYVEDGVGSIARGLYRIEQEHGARAAADEAQRVISFFRVEWLALMKKVRQAEPEAFATPMTHPPEESSNNQPRSSVVTK